MLHVCLTHDVDRVSKTYQYITKPIKYILKGQVKRAWRSVKPLLMGENPYWGFNDVIDIENRFQVKSTFFFLNESVKGNIFHPSSLKLSLGRYDIHSETVRDMIQWLDRNGWEIGVHGSYNSFANVDLLAFEKQELEKIVGHEISGIRQHYLNWNKDTWKKQNEVGFRYDSTWGYTNQIGWKDDVIQPVFPLDNCFCEIPLVVMDSCFQSTVDKWDRLDELMKTASERDAYLVVNFHTNNFDEVDHPLYKENYIRIIEKAKQFGATFCTMGEAYIQIISTKKYN